MTIGEILKVTEEYFKNKNLKNPRLDAEILLAEVLNTNRLNLYLQQDKPLKEFEIDKYREFVKLRAIHKPIQYIVGYTEFFGHKMLLNEKVLIPRPDTEILVEKSIEIIKENNLKRVLDIGFGSGCIILSIAEKFPSNQFVGIDISKDALDIANKNLEINKISNVKLELCDIGNYTPEKKFDLIVSNPPYISKQEFELLDKEVKDFEPKIALTDDADGLKFYKMIIERAKDLLNKDGYLIFEISYNQFNEVENLLNNANFKDIFALRDYNNHIRVIGGKIN
ncbi:MAG TPA: peptide chain release factor N(5)-glutamine methyltransferase [Ignavibacteriales bacterium]|nr:peptide chain release factor N(5)-glutamine methyltransferase [Ignavibacteriales bacterium]HOL81996.1 peptide chain release factor N(5)-glutamine methyltransferase [Ignavibacteriales bacterium]HOM64960.1 peptide chain release factor N(5)-glutamine methyltransferase [Ignavibacteriales bacterium]HPD68312.1 peptide chain release factor N(5)-glutamine methyltransferase [Ignavibacteriales bacterium]HPP34133.1 peptide chain release factor N(5)-glutamine methyltransferase [Ignavibacteriales bacteri